ncbi:wiskott-Aldrich syndrome protein homolog 1-like [Sarcophilus harrisii]|uniref:wiskott-Aldrich syndrome protein homolog 1-like n=1 Tax=Sarcophilus harrisii TaxID=9305 RepID=UPI0013020157|nr:wiskott-Aldrich syndrome protein homolog 1-like [Sarcophilus harrisii]
MCADLERAWARVGGEGSRSVGLSSRLGSRHVTSRRSLPPPAAAAAAAAQRPQRPLPSKAPVLFCQRSFSLRPYNVPGAGACAGGGASPAAPPPCTPTSAPPPRAAHTSTRTLPRVSPRPRHVIPLTALRGLLRGGRTPQPPDAASPSERGVASVYTSRTPEFPLAALDAPGQQDFLENERVTVR